MTVMATSGTEKTIDELIRLSYVLAGLLEETQTLTAVGGGSIARSFLGTIVSTLQGYGIMARAASFYNLTLVSGTSEYSMPSHVLDVFGDAMYIAADEADVDAASSETLVTQASADTWHSQGNKSATGRPSFYFAYRNTTPVKVRLWTIPDEAGTIRFQIHRHLADSSSGSATVDLEQFWVGHMMYRLAEMLAESKSMPADKIGRLAGNARSLLKDARSMSSQRTGSQCYVSHSSGRRR